MKDPVKILDETTDEDLAELADAIRREAIEEAASLVENFPVPLNCAADRDMLIAKAIRALLDPSEPTALPEPQEPAEELQEAPAQEERCDEPKAS